MKLSSISLVTALLASSAIAAELPWGGRLPPLPDLHPATNRAQAGSHQGRHPHFPPPHSGTTPAQGPNQGAEPQAPHAQPPQYHPLGAHSQVTAHLPPQYHLREAQSQAFRPQPPQSLFWPEGAHPQVPGHRPPPHHPREAQSPGAHPQVPGHLPPPHHPPQSQSSSQHHFWPEGAHRQISHLPLDYQHSPSGAYSQVPAHLPPQQHSRREAQSQASRPWPGGAHRQIPHLPLHYQPSPWGAQPQVPPLQPPQRQPADLQHLSSLPERPSSADLPTPPRKILPDTKEIPPPRGGVKLYGPEHAHQVIQDARDVLDGSVQHLESGMARFQQTDPRAAAWAKERDERLAEYYHLRRLQNQDTRKQNVRISHMRKALAYKKHASDSLARNFAQI